MYGREGKPTKFKVNFTLNLHMHMNTVEHLMGDIL